MSQFARYPASLAIASNPSSGTTGSAVPSQATYVGGQNPSGNLQGVAITTAGALQVDASASTQPVSGTVSVSNFPATQPISAVSLPLATGAATAAKQPALGTAGTPSTDVISVQGVASGTALPISVAALPLPTGAATSALQTTGNTSLATIATNTPALGQAVMASSSPVVIASNQSAVPISGTITATTSITATGSNQIKGNIAGTSLTTSYATVITPTFITATLFVFNSCNQTIVISINGGTTDCWELEVGEAVSWDAAANSRSIAASVNIQAKAKSTIPTSGTVRITAVG
jgi:hypothetical protein